MSYRWETNNYSAYLLAGKDRIRVVSNINMVLGDGEIVALIGESGSGKSVLWKSMFGLMDHEMWSAEGTVSLGGIQLDLNDEKKLRQIRGRETGVILQDAMSSFDQVFTIERHFYETAKAHVQWSREKTRKKAIELLQRLYIREPEKVLKMYPFQCSGGMLQRIMVAIALMFDPIMLIADEPTTSVDITIRREILSMLIELNEKQNTSILFISHDLRSVEHIADRIYVMYAGWLVESFPSELLQTDKICHPYTRKLLESRPSFTRDRLQTLKGNPPALRERSGRGCPFAARCPDADTCCLTYDMEGVDLGGGHGVRCIRVR